MKTSISIYILMGLAFISGVTVYGNAPVLVDVDWLEDNFIKNDLVILDLDAEDDGIFITASGKTAFDFDLMDVFNMDSRLKDAGELEDLLGKAGVSEKSRVVVYDNNGGMNAAFMYWLLDYLGHQGDHSILNGGVDAWLAMGGSTDKQAGIPEFLGYKSAVQPGLLADRVRVETAMADVYTQIIDSRDYDMYCGGHIPTSASYFWQDSMSYDMMMDGAPVWLPMNQLAARFSALKPEYPVISYCQIGLAAAHNYVSLKALGYENIAVYEGSMTDWIDRPEYSMDACMDGGGYARLALNSDIYRPGDTLDLQLRVIHPDLATLADVYVLLEFNGMFYFFPQWTTTPSYVMEELGTGESRFWNILSVTMPANIPTLGPFYVHTAVFEAMTFDLITSYDTQMFWLER